MGGAAERRRNRLRGSSVASGLRLPSTGVSNRSEIADGQRPRRCAYQTVPAPQASVPSTRKARQ